LRIYNPLTGLWDFYSYSSHDTFNFYLSHPLIFNLVGFLGNCPPIKEYPNPDDPFAPYDLLDYSENWQRWYPSPAYYGGTPGQNLPLPVPWGVIEAPCNENEFCQVCIEKEQEGAPINTIAQPINSDTETPDAIFSSGALTIGNLRPNEGFFLWIKRTIVSTSTGCKDDFFSIEANGESVSWPLTTGGP
jgi:hypothetical protein